LYDSFYIRFMCFYRNIRSEEAKDEDASDSSASETEMSQFVDLESAEVLADAFNESEVNEVLETSATQSDKVQGFLYNPGTD